jgi:hypothetical protein
MLKAIELGLLAVSVLVFLGLAITAPARRKNRTNAPAEDVARQSDAGRE